MEFESENAQAKGVTGRARQKPNYDLKFVLNIFFDKIYSYKCT